MHTLQRLTTMMVLGLGCLPLATLALSVPAKRSETEQELRQAIDRAAKTYQSRPRTVQAKEITEAQNALAAIAKEKREVRLKIASAKSELEALQSEHGVVTTDPSFPDLALGQQMTLVDLLRRIAVQTMDVGEDVSGTDLLSFLLSSPLNAFLGSDALLRTNLRAHGELLSLINSVGAHDAVLRASAGEYALLQKEYVAKDKTVDRVQGGSYTGTPDTARIKQVFEEVHRQVLRLQGELARIDARLRARAERTLIEKGLRDARPGQYADGIMPFDQSFIWPAYGPISAGFMDSAYQKFFGIPHCGMDIVIGQGSPVVSAADGVVFLARDGGGSGYSYVLVGHRGGYATLYGHLSVISVSAGQDIRAGEVIGLSGGTPGTHGAGPTTTGAHLHFEVVKGGVNVNPRGELP
ncbi:MAG: peptidoglycan DD-metalloendopeptidase family protein [Candidatus Peregrinibacteria bacterium]